MFIQLLIYKNKLEKKIYLFIFFTLKTISFFKSNQYDSMPNWSNCLPLQLKPAFFTVNWLTARPIRFSRLFVAISINIFFLSVKKEQTKKKNMVFFFFAILLLAVTMFFSFFFWAQCDKKIGFNNTGKKEEMYAAKAVFLLISIWLVHFVVSDFWPSAVWSTMSVTGYTFLFFEFFVLLEVIKIMGTEKMVRKR